VIELSPKIYVVNFQFMALRNRPMCSGC